MTSSTSSARKFDFLFDSEFIGNREQKFGKSFCPIGYFNNSDTGLVMAEDGTVYWVIDADWGYFADNFVLALNRVLQGIVVLFAR